MKARHSHGSLGDLLGRVRASRGRGDIANGLPQQGREVGTRTVGRADKHDPPSWHFGSRGQASEGSWRERDIASSLIPLRTMPHDYSGRFERIQVM